VNWRVWSGVVLTLRPPLPDNEGTDVRAAGGGNDRSIVQARQAFLQLLQQLMLDREAV